MVAATLVAAQPGTAATPSCKGKVATIVGTSGPDTLVGTGKRDVIVGLAGGDVISGLGGDDLLCGGMGADLLEGGPGHDQLWGGDDRYAEDPAGSYLLGDTLVGGPGDDLLSGGWDDRKVDTRRRPDTVSWADATGGVDVDLSTGTATGSGTDTITLLPRLAVQGSSYDDTVTGSDGPDLISGEGGDDVILGGDGDDTIYTEAATVSSDADADNDVVGAGPGNDLVSSQVGRDALSGGAGRDFVEAYSAAPTSVAAGPGHDYVAQNVVPTAGLVSEGGGGRDTVVFYGTLLEGRTPRTEFVVDLRTGTTSADVEPEATGTVGGYQEFRFVGRLDWRFFGSAEVDRVWAITGGPLRARLAAGDDWVTGTDRDDLLNGGIGTDEAWGRGGDDECEGMERGAC